MRIRFGCGLDSRIYGNMLQVFGTLSDDEYSSSMLESSAAYKDSCDPVRLESKPPSSVPEKTHFSCSSNNAPPSSGTCCCVTDWFPMSWTNSWLFCIPAKPFKMKALSYIASKCRKPLSEQHSTTSQKNTILSKTGVKNWNNTILNQIFDDIPLHNLQFPEPPPLIFFQQRLRWSRGSVLAFSTQVRGFKPSRSRGIFRAKKSSACLPSEGK